MEIFVVFKKAGEGISAFALIFVLIFAVKLFSSTNVPNQDGDYKIKKNQTEYVLQKGYIDIQGSFKVKPYYHSNYTMGWHEDYTDRLIKVNGNFTHFSGTIQLPTTFGNEKSTLLNYWASNPLPIGAYPGNLSLFMSDSEENRILNEMYNTITSELRTLSTLQNAFRVEIYGDGRLLYTSPNMLYQNDPITFNVNVAGVQDITLKWTYLYITYGGDYGRSQIRISNLTGHTN